MRWIQVTLRSLLPDKLSEARMTPCHWGRLLQSPSLLPSRHFQDVASWSLNSDDGTVVAFLQPGEPSLGIHQIRPRLHDRSG